MTTVVLYVGATGVEIWKGNWTLATVFAAYAVANFALARSGGGY
jgi:hypothetical protein